MTGNVLSQSEHLWWWGTWWFISFSKYREHLCVYTGLTIVIPSSPYDAKGLLLSSIESNDPVLFFEHKAYRFLKEEVPEDYYTVPPRKSDVKREGKDITVFTWIVCKLLASHDILATDGISVEIVDLRTVYPLDKETIIERAKMNGKILLITEDNLEGSVMSEVSAIIVKTVYLNLMHLL